MHKYFYTFDIHEIITFIHQKFHMMIQGKHKNKILKVLEAIFLHILEDYSFSVVSSLTGSENAFHYIEISVFYL